MEINWSKLIEPESLALVLIFGLPVVIGGVISITKMVMRHRERIAMIEHGIHPDHPPEGEDSEIAADDSART